MSKRRVADNEIMAVMAKGRSDYWLARVDEVTALNTRQNVITIAS